MRMRFREVKENPEKRIEESPLLKRARIMMEEEHQRQREESLRFQREAMDRLFFDDWR